MHRDRSFLTSQSWYSILGSMALFAFLSGVAGAQGTGNTGGNTGGNAGGEAGIGSGGLNPDEVFSGVQRTGVVGQSGSTPVGASAASTAGQQGGTTGGRTSGLGGFGGGGGGLGAAFGNLFGNSNSQAGSNNATPIRTRLRAAVSLPTSSSIAPERASSMATNRLRQLSSLQPKQAVYSRGRYDSVMVQIEGRTAILTGQVGSESDRRMSQLMMRLEPGVSAIQNRIELSPGR